MKEISDQQDANGFSHAMERIVIHNGNIITYNYFTLEPVQVVRKIEKKMEII